MSDRTRAEQKASKHRKTQISVSSGEGRPKSARSAKSVVRTSLDYGWKGDDESEHPQGWSESTRRMTAQAIEHDRFERAVTSSGQRRRDAVEQNVRRLRDMRVGEDRVVAEESLIHDLQELEDRRLAEKLAEQQTALDHARRTMELQKQKTAALEAELHAERAKTEHYQSVVREHEQQETHLTDTSLAAMKLQTQQRLSDVLLAPETGSNNTITHEVRSQLDFSNRVILQRYRIADIMKTGRSQVPDQGIQWGDDGKPYETRPAKNRNTSVKGDEPRTSVNPEKRSMAAGPSRVKDAGRSRVKTQDAQPEESPDKAFANEIKPHGFYERAGTAPAHMPEGPPSDDGSSSSATTSDSDESAYRPERNYSRSEDTDSAMDTDRGDKGLNGKSSGNHDAGRGGRDGGTPPGGGKSSEDDSPSSSGAGSAHSG
ncbi:hypothetical protein B0H13DRAFT_2301301 [Mycena leptocephala]|nr:hypothetical protein B0H13DRAFT_2301301 [Mycena leptocephala]